MSINQSEEMCSLLAGGECEKSLKGALTGTSESETFCLERVEWFVSCTDPNYE